MELVVSLAIASVAFLSYVGYTQSVRNQQSYLRNLTAATFLLQSRLDDFRQGKLARLSPPSPWTQRDDGTWVYPSAPEAYVIEGEDTKFQWQFTAEESPEAGKVFACKAVITWKERTRTERISAGTQVWLK